MEEFGQKLWKMRENNLHTKIQDKHKAILFGEKAESKNKLSRAHSQQRLLRERAPADQNR